MAKYLPVVLILAAVMAVGLSTPVRGANETSEEGGVLSLSNYTGMQYNDTENGNITTRVLPLEAGKFQAALSKEEESSESDTLQSSESARGGYGGYNDPVYSSYEEYDESGSYSDYGGRRRHEGYGRRGRGSKGRGGYGGHRRHEGYGRRGRGSNDRGGYEGRRGRKGYGSRGWRSNESSGYRG